MGKLYVLNYQAADCSFDVTCNGFPVGQCKDGGFGLIQLNPFMIGKGNVLRLRFTAKGPKAELTGGVQEPQQGDVVESTRPGALSLPAGDELVHTFDGEEDGFKRVLDGAKKTDAKAILDFAIRYRDAVKSGDAASLRKFNRIRVADAAAAYGMAVEAIEPQLLGMLEFFKDGGVDVKAADLTATPWCDGRIWEVRRKNGDPFLCKRGDDGVNSSPFFAAVMEDGPQVVR